MTMEDHMSPPAKTRHIPSPPHPHERHEPLPWHKPKSAEEDADAPRRVEEILHSASYREADEDPDFLSRDDVRGLRLQVDYLKPELLLQQHQIEHTIVVFGSTRIAERSASARKVQQIRAELESDPDNTVLRRHLKTAESILAKSRYYDVARELGALIGNATAQRGRGQLVVMTGGGPGIMEAANRGAYDAHHKSVGLNINLPHEQFPNPYITPELCFRFHYFALRKLHFLLRAKALVAFPGGYGTMDELFEVLTLIQTRKIKPLPVVLVGKAFWHRAFNVEFLVDEGVIDREDKDLFWIAEEADEIWDGILQWYERAGEPLIAK